MTRTRTRHPPDDRPVGEVLWFFVRASRKHHAFEIVDGEVEPLSVCGNSELSKADDEPLRDLEPLVGRACFYCSELVLPFEPTRRRTAVAPVEPDRCLYCPAPITPNEAARWGTCAACRPA